MTIQVVSSQPSLASNQGPTPTVSGRDVVRTCPKAKEPIALGYEAYGNPSHDALLCIPGLSAQMIMYPVEWCQKMADELNLYVIRCDNRDAGMGSHLDHMGNPNIIKLKLKMMCGRKISESKVPYTLADMALDNLALLDHLKIQKAHILGASMGGMIAQEFALAHPHRTISLISVMSSPGGKVKDASLFFQLKLLKPTPKELEPRVKFGVKLFKNLATPESWTPADQAEADALWREQYAREPYTLGGGRQMGAILQANAGKGRQERLKNLRIPTMVIHGAGDRLIPCSQSEVIAKCIPGSKLRIIPEMGHDWLGFNREKCHPALKEHFEAFSPTPSAFRTK